MYTCSWFATVTPCDSPTGNKPPHVHVKCAPQQMIPFSLASQTVDSSVQILVNVVTNRADPRLVTCFRQSPGCWRGGGSRRRGEHRKRTALFLCASVLSVGTVLSRVPAECCHSQHWLKGHCCVAPHSCMCVHMSLQNVPAALLNSSTVCESSVCVGPD